MIRKRLNYKESQLITANLLIQTNKVLLTNFSKIKQIDQYLSFGFFTLTVGIIFSILEFVYLIVIFTQHFLFLRGLPFEISFMMLIILNCFINGKVMEETSKLFCDLDNININLNNNELYRSFIFLKTSINKIKCGFSIGGFASWNKLTLLQVRNLIII